MIGALINLIVIIIFYYKQILFYICRNFFILIEG